MWLRHSLRAALKRGALVAAANWPLALVQAVADSLFKLLVAVPVFGGIVLATLVLRTGGDALASADWRVLLTGVVTSLLSHRVVLTAFVLSLAIVLVGGSMLMFLVKGGTVGVLSRGEAQAGALEDPPLQPHVVASASAFSVELFLDSARRLFPRYARLGILLMLVYLLSGILCVVVVIGARGAGWGWWGTTIVTAGFVGWTTLVNLLYLLVQVVIAADDCGLRVAGGRVLQLLRRSGAEVAGVFVLVLGLIVLATGASVLAFGALGLISLIPFMWLAAVPLQILAFVLRAVVFQYIGLSSIAAYLTLYRRAGAAVAGPGQPEGVVP